MSLDYVADTDAVQEANRLIFHPLGLHLGEFRYTRSYGITEYDESWHRAELDPAVVARVARRVEELGALRVAQGGAVIEAPAEDVPQLNITIKEPFREEDRAAQPYLRFAGNIEPHDDES